MVGGEGGWQQLSGATSISDLKVTVLGCLGEELCEYFNFCLFGCFYDGLDILAT